MPSEPETSPGNHDTSPIFKAYGAARLALGRGALAGPPQCEDRRIGADSSSVLYIPFKIKERVA